jgi:hypothetical protein
MESVTADSLERNGFDAEAQRVARDAIMKIRLFPDLTIALRAALGYGPHIDMLQHFCYWMHPRHPKMQQRWWMYKTYSEWHDECALTDRQVKKGRKVLRDLGLVTEKKGPYGRVHYRVEWVKLVQALSLDGISDQTDDLGVWFDDPDDDISLDGISDQGQFGHHGDQSSLDGISDQPNTGDYAGDYLSGESTLQVVGEPAFAEPPTTNGNGKKEKEGQPLTTEHPSQNGHTPSETAAVKREVEEVVAPAKPDDALLAEVKEILDPESRRWWGAASIAKHKDTFTPEMVAGYIINNAEDIKRPEVVMSAPRDELVQAVGYLQWEAVA